MQITIRLYRQHDLDLAGLYKTEGFRFQHEMKRVLVSYATGEPYTVNCPAGCVPAGYVPKIMPMRVNLNPQKPEERAVIDMLHSIKKGMRNSFLKALFRSRLNRIPLQSYGMGDGLILSMDDYEAEQEKHQAEEDMRSGNSTQPTAVKPQDVRKEEPADEPQDTPPEETETASVRSEARFTEEYGKPVSSVPDDLPEVPDRESEPVREQSAWQEPDMQQEPVAQQTTDDGLDDDVFADFFKEMEKLAH